MIVTVVSGTNPTFDPVIEESADGATGWQAAGRQKATLTDATGPDSDGTGMYRLLFETTLPYIRLNNALGGTTPSFTYQAWVQPLNL